MESFEDYLAQISDVEHRARMDEVLSWVGREFPNLEPVIKWKQPMFTDHGTFIVAFSTARKHLSVAPEKVVIDHFAEEIARSGYERTKELIRIPWSQPVDYSLLEKMIAFNIAEKAECSKFWRS